MENIEITNLISNLKGRRNYEEKRASKLGFASLYDYFEDKISKQKLQKEKKIFEDKNKLSRKKTTKSKTDCGCC